MLHFSRHRVYHNYDDDITNVRICNGGIKKLLPNLLRVSNMRLILEGVDIKRSYSQLADNMT